MVSQSAKDPVMSSHGMRLRFALELFRNRRWATAGLLLALAQACVSGGQAPRPTLGAAGDANVVQARTVRNAVSPTDLARTSATNLLDALRQLRPEFLLLSTRTVVSSVREPAVFENENYIGTVAQLSGIPIGAVVEIRRLEPTAAKIRFGNSCQCEAGVIHVRTAKP
ncbi:MAG: hypothetical protein ABIS27_06475 [Longimicrobiales bacterium]